MKLTIPAAWSASVICQAPLIAPVSPAASASKR
jgi:hypothetical protein